LSLEILEKGAVLKSCKSGFMYSFKFKDPLSF